MKKISELCNSEGEKTIREVFRYVLENEVDHFEELVYDNFSDDKSEEIWAGDWQDTMRNDPAVFDVVKNHIYFQAWMFAKDYFPDLARITSPIWHR